MARPAGQLTSGKNGQLSCVQRHCHGVARASLLPAQVYYPSALPPPQLYLDNNALNGTIPDAFGGALLLNLFQVDHVSVTSAVHPLAMLPPLLHMQQ